MFVQMTLAVKGLAIYSKDNNPDTKGGQPIPEGANLRHLMWQHDAGYTKGYDLWKAAEAAAEVIGGDIYHLGLAALVGGVWVDTGEGSMLASTECG